MGGLIVFEGLDGSGKATQSKLFVENLKEQGFPVRLISFPNYEDESAALIKQYLSGKILKNPMDVNPYAAASFYSADRFISFVTDWKKDYDSGKLIVADRYVGSNLIHQIVKLKENEWDEFIDWVLNFEHFKLKLPKANAVVYLDMLPEISQKLINFRNSNQKKDIHEQNLTYLLKCREAALFLAEKFSWKVIKCYEDDEVLSISSIKNEILNCLSNVLNLKNFVN